MSVEGTYLQKSNSYVTVIVFKPDTASARISMRASVKMAIDLLKEYLAE